MATLTKQQIADFVAANLGDPQAIASAAAQYGVSASDIADAMGTDVATVNNYFSNAGITLPATPAANTATTPTPTPVTLSPTDSGLVKGNMTYSGGDYQVGVFQQVAAPILTAIQNGTAKVTEDANGVSVTDTATGQVYNKANTGVELDITPNGQLSMTTQVGKAQQGQVVAPISPNGMVTSVDTSTVQQVGYPGSSGGLLGSIFDSLGNINATTVLEAGLAYALPVAGQAIAASLGTSAAVGTAIAATAAGVAQGQDPLTAAKNALPSLVASNLITTSGAQDFLDSVSNNATTQQAISNAATSAIKTAAAGGTASDIFNNMASTVAGTELGSATGSTALGQGIASTIASGNVSSGIVSSAGVLGSQEAATTEKLSKMIPTTDSSGNQLFFDPTSGKTYNPDGTLNAPSAVPSGSIGTQVAGTGVNVGGVGQIVYAENAAALGFDTSKLPAGYSLADQATADAYLKQFGVPLQNTQLPDGTYVSIAPTDFVQSVSPSAVTTTEQLTNVGIDVGTVPSKNTTTQVSAAPLALSNAASNVTSIIPSNTSGNVSIIPSNLTSNIASNLSNVTIVGSPTNLGNVTVTGNQAANLSNVTVTGQQPATLGNVAITGTPSNLGNVTVTGSPTNLGNVTIVGQKPANLGDVTVVGQQPEDLGNVTVTGTQNNLGNVTITSTPGNNVSSNVTDNNASNVVVTTSYVKPKTTSVLPSLVGQFSSPLTASPSAFTPAGSIPGQETGKEREDVWNVESLREGLGI